MRPAKGFGHAARGNAIDLHQEKDEHQRPGKRRDQPLKGVIKAIHLRSAAAYLTLYVRFILQNLAPKVSKRCIMPSTCGLVKQ
jgi:hypothetical protein